MAYSNYQKWSADTAVTLTSVNWNNDYRDVVYFDDGQAGLDLWIDEQAESVRIEKLSLAKFGQRVKIDMPFNQAMRFNYIRVSNPEMPITDDAGIPNDIQRNYYYFVLGYEYENPKTTILTLQLDVWQTFIYDVQFGQCYVERGHLAIANANQFQNYGRNYLTVAEGMDIGSEYRIVHTATSSMPVADMNVLVCSTVDLTVAPGTVGAPTLNSATGSSFNGLPTGANFYIFKEVADFENFMTAYSDKPWITQAIISISIVPLSRYYPPEFDIFATNVSPTTGVTFYKAPPFRGQKKSTPLMAAWRDADFIGNILGSRYSILKKFYTFPYMAIELTTWTGSPLVIRPESWQDADATVDELSAFMPPGQRIAMIPHRYNADAETNPDGFQEDDNGEFLDFATVIDNFPSLPLVNDMAINFLAANKNGLQFSFTNAAWDQQRALAGAQAGAGVANSQIGNTIRTAGIGNVNQAQMTGIDIRQTMSQGILGAGGDVARGIAGGNPASAMAGVGGGVLEAASMAVNIGAMNERAATGQAMRNAYAGSDIQAAGEIRDTNLGYANMAANGDYGNALAGINARIQDARLTQPSTSGQFGGDAFNLANDQFGYSLRWKMMNLNSLRAIGDYWLRYGYNIHQYVLTLPTNFKCMTRFTYWKLSETYLTRAFIPEGFKQTIRGILEKGVTVWDQPGYIGTTDLADNQPLEGIVY